MKSINEYVIEDEIYENILQRLYWEKFEKKFEQLVPKIICKYIETNLKEVAFDPSSLNEENYLKTII